VNCHLFQVFYELYSFFEAFLFEYHEHVKNVAAKLIFMRLLNCIALVLIYFLAFISGFLFGAHYVESVSGNRAMVYAAAVVSGGGGALAEVWAEVRPGTGRVFLTVNPRAELDTQESAKVAAQVASRLAGRPLLFQDIAFTINAPSAIVGGPSAGAAMAVAAYGALVDRQPRTDVVITGELFPDGSIGPVGGLVEKLEACAEKGIRVFLIPAGERYVRVAKPVTKKLTPLPGVVVVERSVRWETVDLYELGREKGVDVVEVSSVSEALPYFFSSVS